MSSIRLFFSFFNWYIFISTFYEYFFLKQKQKTIKDKLMTEHYLLILIFINPPVFSVCFPLNRCRVAKTNKLWLAKLSLCSQQTNIVYIHTITFFLSLGFIFLFFIIFNIFECLLVKKRISFISVRNYNNNNNNKLDSKIYQKRFYHFQTVEIVTC